MEIETHHNDNDHHHDQHIIDIQIDNYSSSSLSRSSSDVESYHSTRSSPFTDDGSYHSVRSSNEETTSFTCGCDCLWNSIEFVVTLVQIVAAVLVLTLAKDEHPQALLLAWLIVYTCGCVITLFLFSLRFRKFNQIEEYPRTRMDVLMDVLKIVIIGSLFVIWSVLGIIWIFNGHISTFEAPTHYRLCVVFIAFNCIRYGGAVVLCMGYRLLQICVLIKILGLGGTSIALRLYVLAVFNVLRSFAVALLEELRSNHVGEGLPGGSLSRTPIQDDVQCCCICLGGFNEGQTRRLDCSHVFHLQCITKWLRVKPTCPLCQSHQEIINEGYEKTLRCWFF